ncbi:MAG: polysaccharide biosynthesis tyrosine autokinase [Akkermansiaceae bacterium]|nr:polysaccharide biosynthesis tyrosine autokinase [Akkermansiaceae bacterium]
MNQTNGNDPSEAALHAVDYWQVIKNRYGIILLTLLMVLLTALVVTYCMPEKYESEAIIQVNPPGQGIDPLGPNMSQISGKVTPQFFATEFEVITSRNTLLRVAEELPTLRKKWGGITQEQVATRLKGVIRTENIRGTDLIAIRVRLEDKELARDIAQEVVAAYRDYRLEIAKRKAEVQLRELYNAVTRQRDKVTERRNARAAIMREKGIIPKGADAFFSGPNYDEDMTVRDAMRIAFELEQEKVRLESQIKSLENYSSDQLLAYAADLDLPANIIRKLHPEYLELKRYYEGLGLEGYGPNHPKSLAAKANLDEMEKQLNQGVVNLRETLQAELEVAASRLERVEEIRDKAKDDAIGRGIDAQDYVDLEDKLEHDLIVLRELEMKQVAERISEKIPEEIVEIHEHPVVADSPVSPNFMLNMVLGGVLGLVFGVGVAFFLEYIDTSVKSLEDVERYLQVPVLAVVPKDVGVLHAQAGASPDAEAYRILRTNIEFNRKNPEDNAITVVSGGAGEGKSTTLVNLAYICAQGGYTTLMIDADLRRPRLHTFFDISNSMGLSNYLTTNLELEDVIVQTPVDNLYFMPSGVLPSDAAGILNSRRMSELIQDVKQRFDLVLVDSPPILGVSDASVLASEVDLTMLVVQHRKLPRNMLMRVKSAVENVGGNVVGVVLNNVDVRSDSQYQYYTSYYTYYAPNDAEARGASASRADKTAAAETKNHASDADLY